MPGIKVPAQAGGDQWINSSEGKGVRPRVPQGSDVSALAALEAAGSRGLDAVQEARGAKHPIVNPQKLKAQAPKG